MKWYGLVLTALALSLALALPATALAARAQPQPPAPTGITGTVTSASGGSGISGAIVTAYQYNKSKGWQSKGATATATDGRFTLALAAGTYRVGFVAATYATEFFSGAAVVTAGNDVSVISGKLTSVSTELSSAFIDGGTLAVLNGRDVAVSWVAGVAPYEVWRSADPADPSSWQLVGTTSATSFTDPAPLRTTYVYKVSSAGAGQWTSPSQGIVIPGGTGTVGDPYLIRTLADLDSVRWNPVGYYEQISDIDASPTRLWNGGLGWEPIGGDGTPHKDFVYDGGGHTIVGLYAAKAFQYNGLFGCVSNATVKNLVLMNVEVAGSSTIGGIVGGCQQLPSRIENCSVTGVVRDATPSVSSFSIGGIAGAFSGTIENCWANVSLTCDYGGAGPIAGSMNGVVRNCQGAGSISAYKDAGGVVGRGSVTMIGCSATTSISGRERHGGVMGSAEGGTLIEDCYATGPVSCSDARGGGLVGLMWSDNVTIRRSYAVGRVTGTLTGGIVGAPSALATVTDCYYDAQTTWQADNGFGTPKTTAEMQDPATFSGWDFETVWNAPAPGVSYPTLR